MSNRQTWSRQGRPLSTTDAPILVVEDDPDIVALLEATLGRAGHAIVVAGDGAQALALAGAVQPKLVLLDSGIPGSSGVEVCRALRGDIATASAGIIFVTGRHSEADAVAGFAAGADDYVVKPFRAEELLARTNALLTRSQELRGLSPLTGLPGNFSIEREITRLIDRGAGFALLYVDLDHFKAFNDRYGFLRGDAAIAFTAGVLGSAVSTLDSDPRFVGHVGGDDFVVLLAPERAEAAADEIVLAFDATVATLYDPDDARKGYVTVPTRAGHVDASLLALSIGIASTSRRPYGSSHEMVATASEMKALAKQAAGSAWRLDRRSASAATGRLRPPAPPTRARDE